MAGLASEILVGDCLEVMRGLPAESFQTCVTSPPYFGLRDYGVSGQIGLEAAPDAYVARLVEVFREVRRCMRPDGTLWLNLGDSYGKGKQLLGVPWRAAFAMQADGWVLRSAIVWAKPSPMPEPVKDRPTASYEMLFLFAKTERYFYDGEPIREPATSSIDDGRRGDGAASGAARTSGGLASGCATHMGVSADGKRNARNVWTIVSKPFKGAHFAVMPLALVEKCIKAGSRPGDAVLDPFFGAGTTGLVAQRLGRSCTGIELSPAYADIARARLADDLAPKVKPVARKPKPSAEAPLFMLAAE